MKDYTYTVFLITSKGREPLLDGCKNIWKARRIAQRIKVKPGRRTIEIERDNKRLPGGQNALDALCYDLWLEANQSEEALA